MVITMDRYEANWDMVRKEDPCNGDWQAVRKRGVGN